MGIVCKLWMQIEASTDYFENKVSAGKSFLIKNLGKALEKTSNKASLLKLKSFEETFDEFQVIFNEGFCKSFAKLFKQLSLTNLS